MKIWGPEDLIRVCLLFIRWLSPIAFSPHGRHKMRLCSHRQLRRRNKSRKGISLRMARESRCPYGYAVWMCRKAACIPTARITFACSQCRTRDAMQWYPENAGVRCAAEAFAALSCAQHPHFRGRASNGRIPRTVTLPHTPCVIRCTSED